MNTYLGRMMSTIVFVFHGMGVAPPYGPFPHWLDIFKEFFFNRFSFSEAIPPFPFNRYGERGGKQTRKRRKKIKVNK